MKKRKNNLIIAGIISLTIFVSCTQQDPNSNKTQHQTYTTTNNLNIIENINQYPIIKNSNIENYMIKYNDVADNNAKINYNSIRYDKNNNCCYVNDPDQHFGLKFKLGNAGEIISASVYYENETLPDTDITDIISAATCTFGYGYISDEDRIKINDITAQIAAATGEINSSVSLFNKKLDISGNIKDSVSLIDIPAMNQYFTSEDIARADSEMTDILSSEAEDNKINNKVNPLTVPSKPSDKFNISIPSYTRIN